MKYFCCSDRRRSLLQAQPNWNGIDFLEVAGGQQTLLVHFVNPLQTSFSLDQIQIAGGERIRNLAAIEIRTGAAVTEVSPAAQPNVMAVRVDRSGDFSTYTLRLIRSAAEPDRLPDAIDPLLASVPFSFKIECDSGFDCQESASCPPESLPAPDIDYLAKDYASFRRLMLDRLSMLLPNWRERNPADLGIVLVELLAYVSDHLSYQQDAIATEAYLGTARRRTSIRRHARLVDYWLHDGCNARVWVQIRVSHDAVQSQLIPRGTKLLTQLSDRPVRLPSAPATPEAATVFETMQDVDALYVAHNEMQFYTWGGDQCCLPTGAIAATLDNADNQLRHLAAGDVLIFQELRGAKTGERSDADPTRRHAVRLTRVEFAIDPLILTSDPPQPRQVVNIEWSAEDALPFPFTIDWVEDEAPNVPQPISVALGNLVLADHGETIALPEDLGTVPAVRLFHPTAIDRCQPLPPEPVPPRFRPRLQQRPLTQAVRHDDRLFQLEAASEDWRSRLDAGSVPDPLEQALRQREILLLPNPVRTIEAGLHWTIAALQRSYRVRRIGTIFEVYDFAAATGAMQQSPRLALPAIALSSLLNDRITIWKPQRDLISSDDTRAEFVVEVETNGEARLRFGDGQFGDRPAVGSRFAAVYRVGNGTAGNIGADTIAHIVSSEAAITAINNPLAAAGGMEPESAEIVRQWAPVAFRTQERAVTPADYARLAEQFPGVQRAIASFRWTGSWRTVFLTIDRVGGFEIDPAFEQKLRQHLERYRLAGHDLEIESPIFVPIELELRVQVKAEYQVSRVRSALLAVFNNRQQGVFHPDNFTFAQTLYLSSIYAAALSVPGVADVSVIKFQRWGIDSTEGINSGKVRLERREIARLDNDPNFPDRGRFELKLEAVR